MSVLACALIGCLSVPASAPASVAPRLAPVPAAITCTCGRLNSDGSSKCWGCKRKLKRSCSTLTVTDALGRPYTVTVCGSGL